MNESLEQVQSSVKNSLAQCNEQRLRMGDTFKKESLRDNFRGLHITQKGNSLLKQPKK
jgi:hypothetical protein